MKRTVAIIGSGNWGSAIARYIGVNAAKNTNFNTNVNMWVHEELINGQKLSEIINTKHENVKYLPNIKLPPNIIAEPNLEKAIEGASVLVFVIPHQFLEKQLKSIKDILSQKKMAEKSILSVSLIKGIMIDTSGPELLSKQVERELSPWVDECAVLMGANIAQDVAEDTFCESTLGCKSKENGKILAELFQTETFDIQVVEEVPGVELCGALKNIVALGAGLSRGLKLSSSTTAAIIRIGLDEMIRFTNLYYGKVNPEIYFLSCGIADLIATCEGGRNQRVATAWASSPNNVSWQQLEIELLKGQKLQGTITLKEAMEALEQKGRVNEFPLFSTLYNIFFNGAEKTQFLSHFKASRAKL